MPDCPTYPSITELDRRLSLTTDPVAIERIERTKAIVRRQTAEHQRARRQRRAARSPEQLARARAALHPDGLKTCRTCARGLPFSSFPEARAKRDGLWDFCHDCNNRSTPSEGENR